MNLWILSQNEMMLVPVTNKVLWIDDAMTYLDEDTRNPDKDFDIWYGDERLGSYDTLERAKEVLREIFNGLCINCAVEGEYQNIDIEIKARILNNMRKVYEMPKD